MPSGSTTDSENRNFLLGWKPELSIWLQHEDSSRNPAILFIQLRGASMRARGKHPPGRSRRLPLYERSRDAAGGVLGRVDADSSESDGA